MSKQVRNNKRSISKTIPKLNNQIRPKESNFEFNRIAKKLKLTNEPRLKNFKSPTNMNQRFERSTVTSASSTGSSNGSVLSIEDNGVDLIVQIDFECRMIDENQFCIRKNKFDKLDKITYRTLFRRPGFNDFDLRKDDLIGKQYRVIKLMGKGTFSHVYLCNDVIAGKNIALKIFTQRNQASLVKIELQIVLHLKNQDLKDSFNFVKMLDKFRCRNQFFIVYEGLSLSLYDFMAKVRKAPYKMNEIQKISKQICLTIDFLHSKCKIIHTDIKPENILFVDQLNSQNELSSLKIKLIDFGSSLIVEDKTKNFGTVTTRHYRAPEVLMKCDWSFPIDVFSVGVTVFELYTQILLFPSVTNNFQHVIIMHFTLGELPSIFRASKPHYFKGLKNLDQEEERKYKRLETYFKLNELSSKQLYRFIKKMLIYEPGKRPTMKEILNDPFIKYV